MDNDYSHRLEDDKTPELTNLLKELNAKVEVISGVPVFTISTKDIMLSISEIAKIFRKNPVLRIINSDFIENATSSGIDRDSIEESDFRRVSSGSGFDVWGVEKKALEMGLSRSDVFCGSPYEFFIKDKYFSEGLGIPVDRSAVLIFDDDKVQEIARTDGYIFSDPDNKKEALLGVIKFERLTLEFEKELISCKSIEEKIKVLEKEIFQNLNKKEDLKKVPYIALNITRLLYKESSENNDSSLDLISKMKELVKRLKYEARMINIVDDFRRQLSMTRKAFETSDINRMRVMDDFPDFVIKLINGYFKDLEVDEKYRNQLYAVIEEAEQCKKDFNL